MKAPGLLKRAAELQTIQVPNFLKRALEQEEEKGSLRSKLLGGAALGGIAASPFLGMIGEDPITKDPYTNKDIKRYKLTQLQRMARPGDVLVSTKNKWGQGIWKVPQVLSTGSDFYHAEPIFGKGHSIEAGQFRDPEWGSLLNPADPEGPIKKAIKPITTTFKDQDVVLMRPDTHLTPKQQQQFLKNIYARSHTNYDTMMALKAYFQDMFLPKFKGDSVRTTCTGDVCSTMPSQAMADVVGERVHPNKAPNRTLPADFLRSQSGYTPVGATNNFGSVLKNRALARGLFRGGVGAGMAGTAYGVYKEPELGAGIAGALAAPPLLQHLYVNEQLGRNAGMDIDDIANMARDKLPTMMDTAATVGYKNQASDAIRKNFLRRSLPLAALGGLGAYGAAKGVHTLADKAIARWRRGKESEPTK